MKIVDCILPPKNDGLPQSAFMISNKEYDKENCLIRLTGRKNMGRNSHMGKNTWKKAWSLFLSLTLLLTSVGTALANSDAYGKWHVDFNSFEEERDFAAEFNKELMAEGAVLMKNDNNTLPLHAENITLFGSRSYNPVKGGSGSGGSYKDDPRAVTLPQTLKDAGYNVNPVVEAAYGRGAEFEQGPAVLRDLEGSYVWYGDAAIITYSRTSAEGRDLEKFNVRGHSDKTETELELDDNEKALLQYVEQYFDKVIVIINSAAVMELQDLVNDPKVAAILWIGMPGHSGLGAVGKLFNGEVNPSGALVDLWMADLKKDPTWPNHATNMQNNEYDPVTGQPTGEVIYNNNAYRLAEDGTYVAGDRTFIVEYEEGIYLGYKYYETVYAEILARTIGYDTQSKELYTVTDSAPAAADVQANADAWWNDAVVFPFGYGMSYTTFTQEILTAGDALAQAINAQNGLDDTVTVQVKVTNTGSVAGKHIVQLYETAPYTYGGIEKAAVSLVSFAKTKLLAPGESQVVELDVRIADLASFDYDNRSASFAEGNGGYILEEGLYTFSVREGSHDVVASVESALTKKVWNGEGDPENIFSKGDEFDSLLNMKAGGTMQLMSRVDMVGTFPTAAAPQDKLFDEKLMQLLTDSSIEAGTPAEDGNYRNETRFTSYYNSSDDQENDPWYITAEAFADIANQPGCEWTQAVADADGRIEGRTEPTTVVSFSTTMCGWDGQLPHENVGVTYTPIQLYQMAGIDYWSEEVLDGSKIALAQPGQVFEGLTGKQAWTVFMNQLTWEEMTDFISHGSYETHELLAVGKDQSQDADGPAVLSPDGTFWCCETTIASAWNTELAHKQGLLIGNESLFQDVPGWYGSGMNIHRSPFSGRNFEYYSSDGLQGAKIAAAVISGVQSKGMNCYIKHYAVNDQEQNRSGLGTFVSEQAMREIYVKGFEYSVKQGNATGAMTAMNRIGGIRCFGNYRLNTTLLRDEWGFTGAVVTDASSGQVKGNMMIRSGNDLPLSNYSGQDRISGQWDAELRNGFGGVRDGNADGNGVIPESDTQYYVARMAAMRLLWVAANTNVNENSFDQREISLPATVIAYKDAPLSSDVAVINAQELGVGSVVYSCDDLPAGLTINPVTGIISGVPQEVNAEGTQSLILYTIDKWVVVRKYVTFKVDDPWSVTMSDAPGEIAKITYSDEAANSIIGVHFNFEGPDTFGMMMVTYDAMYKAVELQAGQLPEGVTMSADGTISGTMPAEGFDIDVTVLGIYDAEAQCAMAYNDAVTEIATRTFHIEAR